MENLNKINEINNASFIEIETQLLIGSERPEEEERWSRWSATSEYRYREYMENETRPQDPRIWHVPRLSDAAT